MRSIDTSPLFTPFRLKGLTLPNRFVMPGMQRQWCVNGRPIPKLVDYYKRRVLGGTPIVITESCAVDHRSATQEPTYARMTDATVEDWAECFRTIRQAGGQMFMQLWHEGAVRREGGDGEYADAPTSTVAGSPVTPGQGFALALANPAYIGITCGGRFFGHGVYATGPATFTMNSFSIQ